MKETMVRPLRVEDIETICEIAVQAWQPIHDCHRRHIDNDDLSERLSHNWQLKKAGQVRDKAQDTPDRVLVSELNGKIVGFATFDMDLETGIGEIGNNAIAPECQGMGIGSAQHRKVLDIFRRHGMKYAIVNTGYEDEGHAGARASYEKVGFRKTKTSVTYSLKL